MNKIKIAIVDDHAVVIDGLRNMLSAYAHLEIVYASQSGHALLENLSSCMPDILLMDIQMPELNGIDLCKLVTRKFPDINIIVFSSFDDSSYVRQVFRGGAKGYLLKNAEKEAIVRAMESVMAGEEVIDESIKKILLQESITGQRRSIFDIPLTKRETEILKMVADGLSNQEIAEKLHISLRTVEAHRLNLNQKLGAKNTAGLVKEALRRGLIG